MHSLIFNLSLHFHGICHVVTTCFMIILTLKYYRLLWKIWLLEQITQKEKYVLVKFLNCLIRIFFIYILSYSNKCDICVDEVVFLKYLRINCARLSFDIVIWKHEQFCSAGVGIHMEICICNEFFCNLFISFERFWSYGSVETSDFWPRLSMYYNK